MRPSVGSRLSTSVMAHDYIIISLGGHVSRRTESDQTNIRALWESYTGGETHNRRHCPYLECLIPFPTIICLQLSLVLLLIPSSFCISFITSI